MFHLAAGCSQCLEGQGFSCLGVVGKEWNGASSRLFPAGYHACGTYPVQGPAVGGSSVLVTACGLKGLDAGGLVGCHVYEYSRPSTRCQPFSQTIHLPAVMPSVD